MGKPTFVQCGDNPSGSSIGALSEVMLSGRARKMFDPNKKHGEPGKYGKQRFAEKVVQPQKDAIDFSKFVGLLDRIVAALNDYATKPHPPNGSG